MQSGVMREGDFCVTPRKMSGFFIEENIMKKTSITLALLAGIIIVFTVSSCGEKEGAAVLACKLANSWSLHTTVPQDSSYVGDLMGDITEDKNGNLFVGGIRYESGTFSTAVGNMIVFKSTDRGKTWSEDDYYRVASGNNLQYHHVRAVTDIEGRPLMAGAYKNADGSIHWLVRRGAVGGGQWETVDDYKFTTDDSALQYVSTYASAARDVAVTSTGKIFVVGTGNTGGGHSQWVVRKSDTGDLGSWTVADHYVRGGSTGSGDAVAWGVAVDSKNSVYVVGESARDNDQAHAIVRKSTDGGDTWTTVSNYNYNTTASTDEKQQSIFVDADDNIYYGTMVAIGASDYKHWVIRRSMDGGKTWQTVDDYARGTTGDDQTPWGMFADTFGGIYAVGAGTSTAGISNLIVRKSTDKGTTWTTIHETPGEDQAFAIAYGGFTDSLGNVFIVGVEGGPSLAYFRGLIYKWSCEQETE